MTRQNSNVIALVLNTKPTRETDLLLTLLTQKQGRVVVVAKGVGHLKSTRRPYLEAGNLVKVHLITTKSLPLVTQAQLLSDTREVRTDLKSLKRLVQFLEIMDRLLVAEELEPTLFEQILYLRELLLKKLGNRHLRPRFQAVLAHLGYGSNSQDSIVSQVNCLLDRRLCAYDYLTVN